MHRRSPKGVDPDLPVVENYMILNRLVKSPSHDRATLYNPNMIRRLMPTSGAVLQVESTPGQACGSAHDRQVLRGSDDQPPAN